ncbi:signal peptidase I [Nesterenkonia sp. LB17]|uniref:signal peptidase I n=1 Tax=unclassified Nesterenkonia TaxID=2629769 RepID=UPI001F4C70C7|nr:signal peptidase I [Nesterenkonia sp. DZ6]MCH8562463.1 signal peptidase I [Nesterenkonia sp. YGD6]MCH8565386.1 signal peptidase I [Nesterenkonia sp. LB17]MCH8571303.1 signal peptidase I [Nesterenkonia sp. AY15]
MLATAVIAVLLATGLRLFVVDVYTVSQVSMAPTLADSERILVEKAYPEDQGVRRGDVIVFDGEGSFTPYVGGGSTLEQLGARVGHWFGIATPPATYVKRVLGTGGDIVACCADSGQLTVNGEPVEEPYLGRDVTAQAPASELSFEAEVPPGRLWVMGDNREQSLDSRALLGAPGGGMISEDRILGRVTGVFWPWNERRELPEALHQHQ